MPTDVPVPRPLFAPALAVWLILGLLRAHVPAQHVATSEPLAARDQLKKFHLPPGFEIELVVSEPEIQKPVNLSFDNRGRLWVSDTVEYPFPAKEGTAPRDTVKVLELEPRSGRATRVTTFAAGLNIPLGVTATTDGAIVYSIPAVCQFHDNDGDGKSDQREVLYAHFGSRDTHGMVNSFTRGLDGWLYACHGFANSSEAKGSDGQTIQMQSGNIFRMRMDGSHLEYFAHGQVNPFGLTFDPLGNLYSADCHTLPIYMLLAGAYYPSFGKAHDGLGFGPPMMQHNHGSTGIGGIAYYTADQFPAEYRDTIFVGNPVTGRVNHDRLEAHGSSYKAVELPDFITCDDPWFRPVNLQVGLDGALYIADFYNRIIGHYEVPLDHPGRDRQRGRIWRVVYTGKSDQRTQTDETPTARSSPNIAEATLEQVIELLGHNNLTVRTLASHELVDRFGARALEPLAAVLKGPSSSFQKAHASWALARLDDLTEELVKLLARNESRLVRVHLMQAIGEQPAWSKSIGEIARRGLEDSDAFVRRAAAAALARHPDKANVPLLLAAWTSAPAGDTHLVHAVRMALRDQLQAQKSITADRLRLEDRRRLAEICLGIPTAESADFIWAELHGTADLQPLDDYVHHLIRHVDANRLAAASRYVSGLPPGTLQQQCDVLRAAARGFQERGVLLPSPLRSTAAQLARRLLTQKQEPSVRLGIELARELNPGVFELLAEAAGPRARFAALRAPAIEACISTEPARASALLVSILNNVSEPQNLREVAAIALARSNTDGARMSLLQSLKAAPEQLATAIAGGLAESDRGAQLLLNVIEQGQASRSLLQNPGVVARLRTHNIPKREERIAALVAGLPPQDARARELIAIRKKSVLAGMGEPARGRALFVKHCATCHRVGEEGAKVGPNLDGIGTRGLDRLLEDVLDPNRNVDQAFCTTQLLTAGGRIVSGLVLREEGKLLVLADAQGKEVRVALEDIDERQLAPLSLMPGNVSETVGETELPHLFGYLLSLKEIISPQSTERARSSEGVESRD